MLNLAAPADAAAPTHMPFRMGALFVGGCTAVPRVRATETAVVAAAAEAVFADKRPRPSAGPVLFGNATTHEARQEKSAWQQPTSQKYAHTTRIAAAGGGAVGPHSARDPV
jgi:hypothetical protein